MTAKPDDRCLRVYRREGIYPSAWNKGRIQKIMRAWAKNTCENCGVSEVPLDCHHIVWRNKHDCRWENLVVLCDRCHSKVHRHQWQPGQPWTMGQTPNWMTSRGYSNPVDEDATANLSDRFLESTEKHIKLGQALQSRGTKILQEPLNESMLKEAAIAIEKGCKIERDARLEILNNSEILDSDRFQGWLRESVTSISRHAALGTALQKSAIDLVAQDGAIAVSAMALDKGAAIERNGLALLEKINRLTVV